MTSPIETHGRDGLLDIIRDELSHPLAVHNVRGKDAVSVEGWTRLLGALDLSHSIHEPQWLADAPGSVQVGATTPTPYGGEQTAWAVGSVPADQRQRHIELSKVQSFAFRRSMRDGWLGLVLAAGVQVGAEEEEGEERATSAPAPTRTQKAKPAPKPSAPARPRAARAPADDSPQAKAIRQQTAIRKSKVGQGKSDEDIAEFDANAAARYNLVWNEKQGTYVPHEE